MLAMLASFPIIVGTADRLNIKDLEAADRPNKNKVARVLICRRATGGETKREKWGAIL